MDQLIRIVRKQSERIVLLALITIKIKRLRDANRLKAIAIRRDQKRVLRYLLAHTLSSTAIYHSFRNFKDLSQFTVIIDATDPPKNSFRFLLAKNRLTAMRRFGRLEILGFSARPRYWSSGVDVANFIYNRYSESPHEFYHDWCLFHCVKHCKDEEFDVVVRAILQYTNFNLRRTVIVYGYTGLKEILKNEVRPEFMDRARRIQAIADELGVPY